MTFTISVSRQAIGYKIEVTVNAESGEEITSVKTSYENTDLAYDTLSPHEVQYQRTFTQVGGYTPGVERIVKVTACNDADKYQTASRKWKD